MNSPSEPDAGAEKMVPSKTAGKQPARSRRSLAARMLGNALGGMPPASSTQEPWRNKKTKTRGKKHI